MSWLLSLALCVAGLLAVIVELFVPAAGIIGLVGLGSMTAGVVLAYSNYGVTVGTTFLIGVVLATPAVLALYFKIFPQSFVGRWLILRSPQRTVEDATAQETDHRQSLVGKEGTAVTSLRPSGTAAIDGSRYSVVSAGDFIEQGDGVVVKRVEGPRIVVRKKG